MRRSTFVKFALPTMLALAAAWAGPAMAQAGKVIKMIPGGDLKIIDPIQNASYISRNHGYMVYDTLFSVDSKGQVKPQMVDTFTLSPDKKKYTFTLRQGLKWHDGAPVTAVHRSGAGAPRTSSAGDARARLLMRRAHVHADAEPFGLVIDALGGLQRAVRGAGRSPDDEPGITTPPKPVHLQRRTSGCRAT
jgi:hypothetical protein